MKFQLIWSSHWESAEVLIIFIGDSISKTFRWSNYQTFSTNNFTTTKWRKDSDKKQNVEDILHWMILMVWIFLTLYEHFKGTKFSKERVTNNKIVFIAMILPNIKKAIAVNCFEKNHSKILCNIRMNTPFYSKVVTNLTR